MEHPVIWPLAASWLYTILTWRFRKCGETEFRHKMEVLFDQGHGVACGASDVLVCHSTVATQLDSPEALNIVFDCLRTVIRLLGDLARSLAFHQALITDDRLVGD